MTPEEYARLFLYVPAGGKKVPLKGWAWSKKCPDGVDPRSEENPWVLTYEETLDEEVLCKIREARPYWDGQFIRVGVVEGYDWIDVDVDVTGHDVNIDDPDKIGFEEDIVSVMRTENGWHLEIVMGEGVLPVRGRHVPGIDYQGTLPGMTGVAGDPFHGSEDYELKNVGGVVDSRHQMTLAPAAISYDGEPLMRPVDEEDAVDGSPESIREVSADLPIDMRAFDLDLKEEERTSHPIHGSSSGANFGIDAGWETWNCYSGRHDHDCGNVTGNAYHFIAMQEAILECGEWMGEGREAWGGKRDEIAEACERRGVPLPPGWEVTADLAPAGEMERGGDESLLWEIRREFSQQMRLVVEQGRSGHLIGPKAVGKTWNAVRLAQDVPVALFAPTKQKYHEIIEEAEDAGVSVLRLPSFPEHSALWDGWESEYLRGAFPREIYNWEERDVGEDEYIRRQDEDFDDYQLLVGAPEHAFVESVVDGRVVIFDDAELDAYREVFSDEIGDQINRVLTAIDSECGNWRQLERSGDWREVERELAAHLSETIEGYEGLTIDEALEMAVVETDVDRRRFLARIPGVSLDAIDWMRALTGDLHSSGAYEDRGMRLLRIDGIKVLVRAPDLSMAEQVFTMGAWPIEEELRAAFDDMGAEYEGMFGSDRHGDMERALNRFVVQTSPHVHNKATGHADPGRVRAIGAGVRRLGAEIGVDEEVEYFSTKEETDRMDGAVNYGRLHGTNEYGGRHLSVVGGSQHFGDDYVKVRAAYAGARPEDPAEAGPYEPRHWEDDLHRRIEDRMRRGGLYEAVTRTGRNDTELTIVAADTCELPPWLQVVDQSDRVRPLSPAAEALLGDIRSADGPVQIKDSRGEGAVDRLDYSAVRLYEARDELREEGLIVEADETGDYNASRFEAAGGEPVSPGVKGLRRSGLTGSAFSAAENPDWEVERLVAGPDSAVDDRQLTLADVLRAG